MGDHLRIPALCSLIISTWADNLHVTQGFSPGDPVPPPRQILHVSKRYDLLRHKVTSPGSFPGTLFKHESLFSRIVETGWNSWREGKFSQRKLDQQQTQPTKSAEFRIEPTPHWWKVSALTTAPKLPFLTKIQMLRERLSLKRDVSLTLKFSAFMRAIMALKDELKLANISGRSFWNLLRRN